MSSRAWRGYWQRPERITGLSDFGDTRRWSGDGNPEVGGSGQSFQDAETDGKIGGKRNKERRWIKDGRVRGDRSVDEIFELQNCNYGLGLYPSTPCGNLQEVCPPVQDARTEV